MKDTFKGINKKIKNKVNIFLNTILPSKIPEFSINNTEEAIFYIYLNKNEISFISHESNKEADEIIKVGVIGDEFAFYPTKKDSAFLNNGFEFKSFEFIEVILSNNLNLIAKKIYDDIVFLGDKILDYKTLYISKLKGITFNIKITDDSNITNTNDSINELFVDAMKIELEKIVKTNILDTPINIFRLIYPDGIYDIERIIEQKSGLDGSMLKTYYNKSNLANPKLMQNFKIDIKDRSLEFHYFIDSVFLDNLINKKMIANASIIIKNIDGINFLPDKILYSNNDFRITIKLDSIIIHNQANSDISLHNLNSNFTIRSEEKPFEIKIDNINLKIPTKEEVSIILKRDIHFGNIKNIDMNMILNTQIKHNIKITYTLKDNNIKNLMGSSQYKLMDIFKTSIIDSI